ncbi:MAG: ABC transporter ATP-binding protein [Planctomycetes bacterium]|nr:ABC transporter ATP-binding protein [Planctomycetota bacterium]MBT4029691.1 ABC transporter ATP-binding protein [Planctomycetota bacterium]MBT7012931.1 ABC transporter ATP-binding protein [Planctomycetota bacterium]
MIQAKQLYKSYGSLRAVVDLSFSVAPGEILGFLGPNGAGKSTTLRILSGFMPPSGGHAAIDQHDLVDDSLSARRSTGYLPERFVAPPELRVAEYLAYRAGLKGLSRMQSKRAIASISTRLGLTPRLKQSFGHLSKGFRQRVGLADALLADPPALLLDEPFAGLDPLQRQDFRNMLQELALDGKAILFSSHVLAEVEPIADRILVLHKGQTLAEGTLPELHALAGHGQSMRITFAVPSPEAALEWARSPLSPDFSLIAKEGNADSLRFTLESNSADWSDLVTWWVMQGFAVESAAIESYSLEDVFSDLIRNREATA